MVMEIIFVNIVLLSLVRFFKTIVQ